jgi:hypothetical protein
MERGEIGKGGSSGFKSSVAWVEGLSAVIVFDG